MAPLWTRLHLHWFQIGRSERPAATQSQLACLWPAASSKVAEEKGRDVGTFGHPQIMGSNARVEGAS